MKDLNSKFADKAILENVDCLIDPVSKQINIPDADMLRRVNYQVKEAEYYYWCAQKSSSLAKIATNIYSANYNKQFKLEVIIDKEDQDNYYRYFKALHYEVTMTSVYRDVTPEDSLQMTLTWS